MSVKHNWECEDCGCIVLFQQPELPGDDPRSEQNDNKKCPECEGTMWWDEATEALTQPSPKHPSEVVREFHEAMGLPSNRVPTALDGDQRALRIALIAEELGELCVELGVDLQLLSNGYSYQTSTHAVKTRDEIELYKVGHELADLEYVVQGSNVTFGLPAAAIFTEVHKANMSKLDDDGQPAFNEKGKILKGENYRPPNVKQFF